MWRVLLVASSESDMECVNRGLRHGGHHVRRVCTGAEALGRYPEADVVFLSLELTDIDGLEVCRAIRAASDIPIIALTASGSEVDRVLGLHAGADDHVSRQCGVRALMARMDAVMRRARPRRDEARVVRRGRLWINTGTREVQVGGRPVHVTRKEFDLLLFLASHPQTVVPRMEIMHHVWDDSWSRRTVDTHVSSLRTKLGRGDWIVNVRGVGYRLGTDAEIDGGPHRDLLRDPT